MNNMSKKAKGIAAYLQKLSIYYSTTQITKLLQVIQQKNPKQELES